MRGILVFLLLLLVPSFASAQVLYVEFKEEKVARRYKRNLSVYKGKTVLIGEARAGITFKDGVINYTSGPQAKNELYVADPARPDKVPYKWQKGEKVPASGKTTVQIAGDEIQRVGYVDRLQTLEGLAADYELRLGEITAAEEARDEHRSGTQEWFLAHGRVLGFMDRLETWLMNSGYPNAAERVGKDRDKEGKAIAKEAMAEREQRALDSVQPIDTPAELIAASEVITGGEAQFHVQESEHVRLTYLTDVPDARATDLLVLAEKIIEGFRREFVDPYRSDTYKDRIPDEVFVEFYFGPDDDVSYERFKTEYYGGSWGSHKDRQMKMQGTWVRAGGRDVNYWRLGEQRDLEATIAHGMGHVLCFHHYSRGTQSPAWLQEGVAYYLSFGFLGRNSVTCFAFADPSYARATAKEGEKTVQRGERGWMNELALSQGPTLDALAAKTLAETSDMDFAKAWSFFDYVAHELGLQGQEWLRESCTVQGDKKTMIPKWRALTEKRFDVTGEDVFRVLDTRWREYATNRQLKN